MPARTANRTTAIPQEIADAAHFATELVNRTLRLVAKGIAAEENSPTPDLKKCASYIATVKRAADALKSLAPLRTAPIQPVATHPGSSSESAPDAPIPALPPELAAIPTPAPIPETNPTPTIHAATSQPGIASSLASLAKLRGKSLRPPASARSYGEHRGRR